MKKTLLFLFPLLLLPTVLMADTVYLKGAGTFEGQILSQTATVVTINIGYGTVGVPMDRIDHIVKATSPLEVYDARASKLAPQDLNGWLALGLWAAQQGLNQQSDDAYQKALNIAPTNAQANEALGNVLLDGRWVTEDESYRARGYVKYNGEWMMPAEAQMLQQTAASEQAQRDAEKQARDAESAALAAQAQAQQTESEAAKAAQNAPDLQQQNDVYWGGYGYGVNTWPTGAVYGQKLNRPAQLPARGTRR